MSCGIKHLCWRTVPRDCLFCCSGVLTGPKQTQFKGVWPENSKRSLFIHLNCTIKKTVSGKLQTLTCSFIKELPLIEAGTFPRLLCLVCKVCLEAADVSAPLVKFYHHLKCLRRIWRSGNYCRNSVSFYTKALFHIYSNI